MNTTALIDHWSMEGAHHDLGIRLVPPVETPAVVPAKTVAPSGGTVYSLPILVKHSEDGDWRPLGGNEDGAAASDVAERLLEY